MDYLTIIGTFKHSKIILKNEKLSFHTYFNLHTIFNHLTLINKIVEPFKINFSHQVIVSDDARASENDSKGKMKFAMLVILFMATQLILPSMADEYIFGPDDPRHEMCAHVHGKESNAKSCPSIVYKVNKEGSNKGNCGYFGSTWYKCLLGNDYLCGSLHCHLPQERSTTSAHFEQVRDKYFVSIAFE